MKTLKLRVKFGYVTSAAPWDHIPQELRSKFSRGEDVGAVNLLNTLGWKTLNVVALDNKETEIWLTHDE